MTSKHLEDYEKKKNLRKVHYNEDDLDEETLKQIYNYEQQALELRRQLGMYADIFIPADHDVVLAGLLLRGVRLMWLEVREGRGAKRMYGTIENFEPVKTNLDAEIDNQILEHIQYDNRKYVRIKVLMERHENIVFIAGKTDALFLKEMGTNFKSKA